jgi:flagellar protein FlaG
MSIEMSNSEALSAYDAAERSTGAKAVREETTEQVRELIKAQQQANAEERELSREEVSKAADSFVELAQTLNKELRFSVNSDLDQTVVQVVDRVSGETIRQIPSEDLVRLAERMRDMSPDKAIDSATGLLIDSRV